MQGKIIKCYRDLSGINKISPSRSFRAVKLLLILKSGGPANYKYLKM